MICNLLSPCMTGIQACVKVFNHVHVFSEFSFVILSRCKPCPVLILSCISRLGIQAIDDGRQHSTSF